MGVVEVGDGCGYFICVGREVDEVRSDGVVSVIWIVLVLGIDGFVDGSCVISNIIINCIKVFYIVLDLIVCCWGIWGYVFVVNFC